jgi:hypothetical protein
MKKGIEADFRADGRRKNKHIFDTLMTAKTAGFGGAKL